MRNLSQTVSKYDIAMAMRKRVDSDKVRFSGLESQSMLAERAAIAEYEASELRRDNIMLFACGFGIGVVLTSALVMVVL